MSARWRSSTLFVFAGILSLCLYLFGGRAPDGLEKILEDAVAKAKKPD